MKHLRQLEDQSVYILREAYKHFDNLAMLWSMGKDSTVLLWLARKAFFGHVPFPLLHVDTSYKIPAMIEYRDRLAREWRLNLVVGQNREALAAGMNHTLGRVACCTALKTNGLKQLIEERGYTGIILGVRADEEGTRAKERYFSPRDKHGDWDFRDQPPELWDQFKTTFPPEHTFVSIRCWIGRRSTFGSTSNTKTFPSWTSIWTKATARVIEVLAVRPARRPSDRLLKRWTTSLRSYDIRMWRSERDGRKMKVAAWSCFAKMDTCEAMKVPSVNCRVVESCLRIVIRR